MGWSRWSVIEALGRGAGKEAVKLQLSHKGARIIRPLLSRVVIVKVYGYWARNTEDERVLTGVVLREVSEPRPRGFRWGSEGFSEDLKVKAG